MAKRLRLVVLTGPEVASLWRRRRRCALKPPACIDYVPCVNKVAESDYSARCGGQWRGGGTCRSPRFPALTPSVAAAARAGARAGHLGLSARWNADRLGAARPAGRWLHRGQGLGRDLLPQPLLPVRRAGRRGRGAPGHAVHVRQPEPQRRPGDGELRGRCRRATQADRGPAARGRPGERPLQEGHRLLRARHPRDDLLDRRVHRAGRGADREVADYLHDGGLVAGVHLSTGRFRRDPLWLAAFGGTLPTVPSPWPHWTFWQYNNAGSLPGIGQTDLDYYSADQRPSRAPPARTGRRPGTSRTRPSRTRPSRDPARAGTGKAALRPSHKPQPSR